LDSYPITKLYLLGLTTQSLSKNFQIKKSTYKFSSSITQMQKIKKLKVGK